MDRLEELQQQIEELKNQVQHEKRQRGILLAKYYYLHDLTKHFELQCNRVMEHLWDVNGYLDNSTYLYEIDEFNIGELLLGIYDGDFNKVKEVLNLMDSTLINEILPMMSNGGIRYKDIENFINERLKD